MIIKNTTNTRDILNNIGLPAYADLQQLTSDHAAAINKQLYCFVSIYGASFIESETFKNAELLAAALYLKETAGGNLYGYGLLKDILTAGVIDLLKRFRIMAGINSDIKTDNDDINLDYIEEHLTAAIAAVMIKLNERK